MTQSISYQNFARFEVVRTCYWINHDSRLLHKSVLGCFFVSFGVEFAEHVNELGLYLYSHAVIHLDGSIGINTTSWKRVNLSVVNEKVILFEQVVVLCQKRLDAWSNEQTHRLIGASD